MRAEEEWAWAVLEERRRWLAARIEAKKQIGWDTVWDQREHDALLVVLEDRE